MLFTLSDDERGVCVTVADLARINAGVAERQTAYHQRLSLPVFTTHLIAARTVDIASVSDSFDIYICFHSTHLVWRLTR